MSAKQPSPAETRAARRAARLRDNLLRRKAAANRPQAADAATAADAEPTDSADSAMDAHGDENR